MAADTLHVFVAIDAHPKSIVLLRAAKAKAQELGCGWTVIYVETPGHDRGERESRRRILQFLTLAEEMGASVQRIERIDKVQAIVASVLQAAEHDKIVHTLIMGKMQKEGFLAELKTPTPERVAQKLLRKTATTVQIIPLSGKHYKPGWFERLQLLDVKATHLLLSLAFVALAVSCAEVLHAMLAQAQWIDSSNTVSAFFFVATMVASLRYGMLAGLLAAAAGFTCFNYFYTLPYYSFGMSRPSESVSLLVFLCTAGIISLIGAYSHASSVSTARKERRNQALHTLYRNASNAENTQDALVAMHEELSDLLEMEVAFFLPSMMQPDQIELVYPSDSPLDEKEQTALHTCWQETRTTGLGAALAPLAGWRFEPMMTAQGHIGIIGIKVPPHIKLDASFGRLISALADQAASVLERVDLNKNMHESRIREEREKLRAMLLSSVSHDLKTPLASIIGALSVYKRMKKAGRLDSDTSDELTETALDEAHRLDSFISNILDMTRIESGDVRFNEEWVDPAVMVTAVQKRLRLRLREHTLEILAPDHAFEVRCDQMMSEQVLQNILDNAGKYSPKHSKITLHYTLRDKHAVFEVRDRGAGIPEDKFEAVFDKYERLKQSDSQVAGTGLGLAISRAIIEKQGGTVAVGNHAEGGAIFTITLPQARLEQTEEKDGH